MDWPYDDDPTVTPDPEGPAWDCPEDVCQCAAVDKEGDPHEFSVMLLSHEGERMGGARVRIIQHGKVLNDESPNAEGSGWITAVLPHPTSTVLVEWAPKDTPKDPLYPYRKRFFVDTEKQPAEKARRKLHNLGYSRYPIFSDNVREFQRDYAYANVSGDYNDIADDLDAYHDEGVAPVRKLKDDRGDGPAPPIPDLKDTGDKKSLNGGASPSKAKTGPDDPVGDPPAEGKGAPPQQPTGGPSSKGKPVAGQGTAQGPMQLPNIVKAFQADELFWEWVPIRTQLKGSKGQVIKAYFWIFGEAMVWEVPDTTEWKDWNTVKSFLPKTPAGFKKIKRYDRLCRLPCNAVDGQTVANSIFTTQSELKSALHAELSGLDVTTFDNADKPELNNARRSLWPTPKLYDQLYCEADVRIGFQYVPGLEKKPTPPLRGMSNTYNKKMNDAIQAKMTKVGKTSIRSVGTPGKIWAIDDRIETLVLRPGESRPRVMVTNYGFHEEHEDPSVTEQPRTKAVAHQPAQLAHDIGESDYSQILVCVAGWCIVKDDTAKHEWKSTKELYLSTDADRWKLVADKQLSQATYTGVGHK